MQGVECVAQVRGYCYFYGVGQTWRLNPHTIVRVLLSGKMYRYKQVGYLDPKFDARLVEIGTCGEVIPIRA